MRRILLMLIMIPWVSHAALSASELSTVAASVNKRTPMMMDDDTRLDKVVVKGGSVLEYRYTMVNYSLSQFDKNKFTNSFKGSLTKQACAKLKHFIENGVEVVYTYNANDGKFLTSIKVNKNSC